MLAYFQLPVAPLPQHRLPGDRVQANMAGASPEIMAATVAEPLERRLGHHRRREPADLDQNVGAASMIIVLFGLNRDINGAARDVQAAIQAARADLPTTLAQQSDVSPVQPGRRADHGARRSPRRRSTASPALRLAPIP